MEIKNLRTFLQVASLKNFTKAGKALGYTQSNISMQIQQLEADVGARLFDRINRGVMLTQYGERLLPYAQQLVSTASQMELFLCSDQEMRGYLRVGLVESLHCTGFAPLYLGYHSRFPNTRMELTVDSTSALLDMLRKNLIDIALVIDDPLPPANWQLCYEKKAQAVVVMAKSNPLAKKEVLTLEDLNGASFVLMEEAAPYNLGFERAMSLLGHPAEPSLRLQNPATALDIVQHSDFVSLLPGYAVQEAVAAGQVAARPITGFSQTQKVQGVLHKDKLVTPLIQGFIDQVQTTFQTLFSL